MVLAFEWSSFFIGVGATVGGLVVLGVLFSFLALGEGMKR